MTGSQASILPVPRVSLDSGATNDVPIQSHPAGAAGLSLAEFQSFVPSVPWQPVFWLGAGVNALTGQVEPHAVVPFKLIPNEKKHSRESFRTIRFESNLMQEHSAAVGAGITLNIGQIGLGADASLLSQARVSATSSSILATYTTTYDWDFDPSSEYELKPAAAALARSDPEIFRQRYGDYFIAGGQRTSTFVALLVYSCMDLETLEKFSTNVTTSLNDLFKMVGSADWAEDARKANVEIKVFVEMRGFIGNAPTAGGSWDASRVVEALDWFKSHEVGNYSVARLQHYSALDPNIPRTIPISGEIFRDIRRLHLLLRGISILSASWPPTDEYASSQPVREADELCQDVDAHQSALAVDSAMCTKFLSAAEALHETLSSAHRRYFFWVQVLNKIPDQPLHRINAVRNQQIWSYGISSSPDSTINILSSEHKLTCPRSFSPFHKYETLSYKGDRLIVGWKIISVRKDGHNGSWRRLTNSILLSTSARIVFRTKLFRSAKWELVIYHVDPKLYQFSGTSPSPYTYAQDDSDSVYH